MHNAAGDADLHKRQSFCRLDQILFSGVRQCDLRNCNGLFIFSCDISLRGAASVCNPVPGKRGIMVFLLGKYHYNVFFFLCELLHRTVRSEPAL